MSAFYLTPRDAAEEHVYWEPLQVNSSGNSKPRPATIIGNSEPQPVNNTQNKELQPVPSTGNTESQPATSTGNDSTRGNSSTKGFQYVVLGINAFLIVALIALVGIFVYLLHMPKMEEPTVNGGWSQWGAWSTCSLTCGSGVTTRFRRCDSPAPSSTDRDCTGDPIEADSCNVAACTEWIIIPNWDDKVRVVGFTAKRPQPNFNNEKQMAFKTILTNEGNAFNARTGLFTCPVAGTYYISAVLYKNKIDDGKACNIFKNRRFLLVSIYTDPQYTAHGMIGSAVKGVYVRLSVGDTIRLGNCKIPIEDVFSMLSTFSGFLVTPDP